MAVLPFLTSSKSRKAQESCMTVRSCAAIFLALLLTCVASKWSIAFIQHFRAPSQGRAAVSGAHESRTPQELAWREVTHLSSRQEQAHASQRKFCTSTHLPLVDAAANIVRYPITFESWVFSIYCYTQKDIVSSTILKHGSWETGISKDMLLAMEEGCLKQNIPKSQAVLLDVGANIGWFTLLLAAAGYKVIAFEPMFENEQLFRKSLCSNAGFNDLVTYHTDILGSSSNTNCTIFSSNDNQGDGIVECNSDFVVPANYSIRQSGAKMTTIDVVLGEQTQPQNIMMVKMDVEGYEGHVFQGAVKSTLDAHVPYVMFEFVYSWIKSKGGQPDALLAKLAQEFYQCSFESFHGVFFDTLAFFSLPESQQGGVVRNIYCVHASMLRS